MSKYFTWKIRRYLYRVGNAGLAVFVVYNVVNGEQAAVFGILLNALLAMADANVTKPLPETADSESYSD